MRRLEWARLPGDAIFIAFGVIPMVIAAGIVYFRLWAKPAPALDS
ncbi:MAG: hypothetical protein P4L43_00780 [Syntrophobacteraceae bacterium]|nr:hypothetical protein [Syntrophobacteraceae bacterium]